MNTLAFFVLATANIVQAFPAIAQVHRRPCVASHYKIIPLPLQPARINNSGVIAGTTEDHQPATWTIKGGLKEMTPPSGFAVAQVFGINQAGTIVGQISRVGSAPGLEATSAFEYSHGRFVLLSQAQSKAKAVNNSGEIAGENTPDGPVAWIHHDLHRLGGCCGGRALAVNTQGQIVGEANDQQGRFYAFLWDRIHGLQSIAPPDTRSSTAVAINNSGHVLVQSFVPNALFLRQNGKLTPIELSAEFASQPLGLNNCDVIVGQYGAASDFNRAFVWDKQHGLRDLNLAVEGGQDWILESATDINDGGEIVGLGDYKDNEDSGFLLVPQSEVPLAKKHR